MIPKIIHYCWFGKNPLPESAKKYMRSWRKYGKGYRIVRWSEENFNLEKAPLYVRQAYQEKKWAFVSDYVRLYVVYRYGGIYLDTDVELIKSFDPLLENEAYFGLEKPGVIATGLGFGAEKKNPLVKKMMAAYEHIPFITENGEYDLSPCPGRNTASIAEELKKVTDFNIVNHIDGAVIYPKEYFNPLDYLSLDFHKTENTMSIHWFACSWLDAKAEKRRRVFLKFCKTVNKIMGRFYAPVTGAVKRIFKLNF